ncbi:MAG TPA: 2OG-Fe(II) oxygenase, partial [Prochlorococcaceae cyanobacterium Fu_MAG_134]|nr:2OG-Fe(II) oxygenase [Prochlorococcaceae cyanobacterium Fu_MAG_134]
MQLIADYRNKGFEAVADGIMTFFDQRTDLHRTGIAFGSDSCASNAEPAKVSTDISLLAIDRSDPEAFALSEVIMRGVNSALDHYLNEHRLFRECCPEQSLFVNP